MFAYTSPKGVQATDDHVIAAAGQYKKFGEFPFYKDIPRTAKRIAGAYMLGAAMGMTVEEVHQEGDGSESFQHLVDALINGYEKVHPESVEPPAALVVVLRELADRLSAVDEPAPVDGDQARFDQEFAGIVAGLKVSGK